MAAAQRLPPSGALEAIDAAAACAYAPNARHLGPLPARLVWSRPAAVVIFSGLVGVPSGDRAVLLRPTRELLARHAVRERIQAGRVSLHDHDLNTLPETAQEIAFMALHVAPPETPPEGCVTPLSN
ncbi:MAG: hypothetical protein INF90_03860 [Roseomonas sp.]|nr:hypothetical protein [Roseomonas sp.]MCA3368660.1 hypothetical protein [Roseomonas sp.]